MQGASRIGAAVIAIMARSAVKLTGLTLGRDKLLWALFGLAALVTAWTESEIVWVFLGAGLVALVARTWPPSRTPRIALSLGLLPPVLFTGLTGQPASAATLGRIASYFAEAGAFVFGSGLAIVPFLHAGVVQRFAWLASGSSDGGGGDDPPGPVVITVGFIGYLVAGAGAVVASWPRSFLLLRSLLALPPSLQERRDWPRGRRHRRRHRRHRGRRLVLDGALFDLTTVATPRTLLLLVRLACARAVAHRGVAVLESS